MRRVVFSAAMSLDGFIAGPRGEYDWIPEEPEIDWTGFLSRFDTVLMGRKSYQAALQHSTAETFTGMSVLVASRKLDRSEHPEVTVVGEGLPEVVKELKTRSGKDIWLFGGGELLRCMLSHRLVDRVELGLVPVILGRGVPLLPPWDGRVQVALDDTRIYRSGIVLVTYRVLPESRI